MTLAIVMSIRLTLTIMMFFVVVTETAAGTGAASNTFLGQTARDHNPTRYDPDLLPTSIHSPRKSHYPLTGIVVTPSTDFEGWQPSSPPPTTIDPNSTPQNYIFSAVVSYNHGISLFNTGYFSQAQEKWEVAIHLQETFAEAHYALGYLYSLQGNSRKANVHANKAWEQKTDWTDAAYQIGLWAYQNGHFSEASQHFLKALQLQSNNPLALNGFGLSKYREGHLPEAEQAFIKIIESNPTLPYPHLNLGLVFFAKHQWKKARHKFTESQKLDPTYPNTHFWLGMTQARMGQWTQAIYSWQGVLAFNPSHSGMHQVYFNLGTAYWMTGNIFEARQAYQAALQYDSALPQAHYQLGVLEMAQSQWNTASEHFLMASDLDPAWDQPFFNLGLVRYQQGLIDEARQAFQDAIAVGPEDSDSHYYLGLTLRLMHQDSDAFLPIEFAAQAGHVAAQDLLANMYAHGRGTKRNITQAIRWWSRASRSHLRGQAADHARAQLSRLRQMYFLHHDNPAYLEDLLKGFQALYHELWKEGRAGHDASTSFNGTSKGIFLASTGRLREAVPLLIREAYALNREAQQYLENLIHRGVLDGSPPLQASVIQYFTQTAYEGSRDSCRVLSSLPPRSGSNTSYSQFASVPTTLCQGLHP